MGQSKWKVPKAASREETVYVHLRPTKEVRPPRDVSPNVLSRTPDQVLTSAVPTVPQTPTTGAESFA